MYISFTRRVVHLFLFAGWRRLWNGAVAFPCYWDAEGDLGMMKRNNHGMMICFTVLFFFVFGLSVGAFTEVFLGEKLHAQAAGYVQSLFQAADQGLSSGQIFWNSLKSNGVLLALMAAGGITVVGFPIALLVLAYKGASLGFTLALLGDTLGAKGILTSLATLLFQNLIFIPMFLLFAFFTLHASLSVLTVRSRGGRMGAYREAMAIYGLCFLGSAAALLGGCFVEAYFSTGLIHIL